MAGPRTTNRLTGYFYFEAAAAYERKGDFDRAEELFEKSLKLEPDMAEALNYYGYMLADHGVKLDKARGLIEKAVKQEPEQRGVPGQPRLGAVQAGQAGTGLAQIQKAIELSEEPDATIYEHLGDIYARLKQDDKAREAWRKSLNVGAERGDQERSWTSPVGIQRPEPRRIRDMHRFQKHYTREEARALLPQLRAWLAELDRLRLKLETGEERLAGLMSTGQDLGGQPVNDRVRLLGGDEGRAAEV